METEYINILKYSYTTEMENLIAFFKTEPEIHVTFLCESEIQAKVLEKVSVLKDYKYNIIIHGDDSDKSIFTSYYFKYVSDNLKDYLFKFKNYYFSTYRLNFDEEELISGKHINELILMNNEIHIMDLYNKIYLTRGEE
jgi:hypothetical protein